jgi:hypothetical protein
MKKYIVSLLVLLGAFFTQAADAQEKTFSVSFPIKEIEAKPIGTSLRISDSLSFSCLVFSPPMERICRDRSSLIKQTEIVGSISLCFRF